MKSVAFTARASAALEAIGRWTTEVFGPAQSSKYEDDMIARVRLLAEGAIVTRSCRDAIAPELDADLRQTHAGRHVIIFVDQPDRVVIIDVLHQSSDLATRLAALGPLD